MANELSTVAITRWKKETKLQFQQVTRRFSDDVVDAYHDVGAGTYKFPKLAKIAATDMPALGSDHAGIASVHEEAAATMTTKTAPLYFFDHEMKQAADSDKLRMKYQRNSLASINRQIDALVATELASDKTDISTTTGAFTYDKFLEAMEKLDAADVDEEDRILVVGPHQVREMFGISEIINNDYSQLHSLQNGKIANILGVKVIKYNGLPTTTTFRKCFLYQRSALGLAFACDPKVEYDYLVQKSQHIVNTYMSAGAEVIEAAGNVQILCDEA